MALCHLNVFMWTCFIQGVLHCNKNTCNTALKPRRGRNKCETMPGNLRVCASVRGTYYRAAMCERGLTVPHVCSLTDSGASLPLCGRKVAGVTAHIGWQETQRGCNKALIHLFILNGRTVLAHPSSLTHTLAVCRWNHIFFTSSCMLREHMPQTASKSLKISQLRLPSSLPWH